MAAAADAKLKDCPALAEVNLKDWPIPGDGCLAGVEIEDFFLAGAGFAARFAAGFRSLLELEAVEELSLSLLAEDGLTWWLLSLEAWWLLVEAVVNAALRK